mmetsp:Transcript_74122/g.176561  ORF Transcript_74122/g.176561 Transcript_74122/m.176561 type:complete len:312 (-) Transcript_74122:1911-2846(-)
MPLAVHERPHHLLDLFFRLGSFHPMSDLHLEVRDGTTSGIRCHPGCSDRVRSVIDCRLLKQEWRCLQRRRLVRERSQPFHAAWKSTPRAEANNIPATHHRKGNACWRQAISNARENVRTNFCRSVGRILSQNNLHIRWHFSTIWDTVPSELVPKDRLTTSVVRWTPLKGNRGCGLAPWDSLGRSRRRGRNRTCAASLGADAPTITNNVGSSHLESVPMAWFKSSALPSACFLLPHALIERKSQHVRVIIPVCGSWALLFFLWLLDFSTIVTCSWVFLRLVIILLLRRRRRLLPYLLWAFEATWIQPRVLLG